MSSLSEALGRGREGYNLLPLNLEPQPLDVEKLLEGHASLVSDPLSLVALAYQIAIANDEGYDYRSNPIPRTYTGGQGEMNIVRYSRDAPDPSLLKPVSAEEFADLVGLSGVNLAYYREGIAQVRNSRGSSLPEAV